MKITNFVTLLVLTVACSAQTSVHRVQPSVVAKHLQLTSGFVRQVKYSDKASIALIDRVDISGNFHVWRLSSTDSRPLISFPKGPVLTALNESYAVSASPGPLESTFQLYPFNGAPKSLRVELTQLIDICALDEALLVIHKRGSYFQLSRVDLSTGKPERLDEFTSDNPILKFGQCDSSSCTILDPISPRFRNYRFSQTNSSPGWLTISSDLIWDLKNRPVPVQLPAGVKGYRPILGGHLQDPEGNSWFLLLDTEKDVGFFAIKTDSSGRETTRLVLAYPANPLQRYRPVASSAIGAMSDGIRLVSSNGTQLFYQEVFGR